MNRNSYNNKWRRLMPVTPSLLVGLETTQPTVGKQALLRTGGSQAASQVDSQVANPMDCRAVVWQGANRPSRAKLHNLMPHSKTWQSANTWQMPPRLQKPHQQAGPGRFCAKTPGNSTNKRRRLLDLQDLHEQKTVAP